MVEAGAGTVWTGEPGSSSMRVSSGEAGLGGGMGGLKGAAKGFAPPLPLPLRLLDIRGLGNGTQLIKVIKHK